MNSKRITTVRPPSNGRYWGICDVATAAPNSVVDGERAVLPCQNASILLTSCLFIIVMVAVTSAASAAEPIEWLFGDGTVTVSGFPNGHRVVLFGAGIGSYAHTALLTYNALWLADDDDDGSVTFTVRHLPSRAIWFAIDYETGTYWIAPGSAQSGRPIAFNGDRWRPGLRDLDVRRQYLRALVVRPGSGAWTLRATDGGTRDADAFQNGILRLRLEQMDRLLGEQHGPPVAVPRDLVVLIDPQTLDYFVDEARQ